MSNANAVDGFTTRTRKKWIVLVALILLTAGAFFLSSSNDDVYSVTVSPDRAYVARVAFRETAEIESAMRFVFVRPAWLPSDNRITSCKAFQAYGQDKISLSWKDKNHLDVRHGFPKPEIHFVGSNCYGISISAMFDPKLEHAK